MSGLRERQKLERRQAISKAAIADGRAHIVLFVQPELIVDRSQRKRLAQVRLERELLDIFVAVKQQVVTDHIPHQPGAPVDKAFTQQVPGFFRLSARLSSPEKLA